MYIGIGAIELLIVSDLRYAKYYKKVREEGKMVLRRRVIRMRYINLFEIKNILEVNI